MQQGVQTDRTCNIQQYWGLLAGSDRDEKIMTVERSYLKGALQIQRPVCRACSSVLVSFTSIHESYTFNLGGI